MAKTKVEQEASCSSAVADVGAAAGASSSSSTVPSSPLSSSHAAEPSSFRDCPALPVAAHRDKIVEKIQENRVTLIVGDTGCGKSSQVPQFLLEENMEPILCTQPRRFAVVAIARMVAISRGCEVGGEVGYHIGHSNVTSQRSRIIFKTAGVLLEQMRDKGLAALKYKVIILDEVHERSVESDLVLACVKQFMTRNKDLRLVLMSATADISRYRDYFKDLGRGERVEVVAIPSSSQQTIYQRKVYYLEHVAEDLGLNSEFLSFTYCSGLNPSSAVAEMRPEVHTLIHKLVLHIHENEPDFEKSILIFLPTYYSLEQQWIRLKPLSSLFKVHILHRSIDTEQALLALKVWKSHRKVILATNIAESSVTIPGVAFVIDSCRSLSVFWDHIRKKDSAELVWVSKSQAEQRKGRTGRTCDGQIYRLVTRTFYNTLNEHEYPAILRLSLRQQVLMMCCAESKAINDPKVLLQKVLDPPDPDVIEDALSLLIHINALERTIFHRDRHEPTFYGRLLDSLPLSFDASVLALKFGENGLLREGILIAILMDVQPFPIIQPFGEQNLFMEYLDGYFESDAEIGKKENIFMGNLCAFQFWQRVFKDKQRLEHLKQILNVGESKASPSLLLKHEEEWCYEHNLVLTSLHNISEIYEDALNTIHKFRPKFLVRTNGLPTYYEPCGFKHTCLLHAELVGDVDVLAADDEDPNSKSGRRKCCALPFVCPADFQAPAVANKLGKLMKEIRMQYVEDTALHQGEISNVIVTQSSSPTLCKFFINGLCNKGNRCIFSHALLARTPPCKFFFTFQGCRNGDSCFYSHDSGPHSSFGTASVCLREDETSSADTFVRLLPAMGNGCILVLNDNDLKFSSNLSMHYDPSNIIVTVSNSRTSDVEAPSTGLTVIWGVSHPSSLILETQGKLSIPWNEVKFILWFADTGSGGAELHYQYLPRFFEYLAIRLLAEAMHDVRVVIIMNNNKFAQLQVEKLGRECFFFLTQSFPFNEQSLGEFAEDEGVAWPMQASLPVCYVFEMHAPSVLQFGDYVAALQKGLYQSR
uniref:Zinc finger CCCH domain-containing protein 4 n=1 Tax=Anthurium amnicola TaxID=1678845 RepID=A0A1D1ZBL2_9ARAE